MLRALLALCLVLITLPARAESVPRSEHVGSLHVTLPFFGYTTVDGRDTYGGLGIAAGVLLHRIWLVDAGAMAAGKEDQSLLSVLVRGGVLPALVDSADIEGGITINAGPFLGYRYDVRKSNDDGYEPVEKVHSLSEGLSVDVTRWWASEVGLSLRFDAALVTPVSRSENDTWRFRKSQSDEFHHALDIRGSIGVAF